MSAYSLYTTAEDMAYFLQAVLSEQPEQSSSAYLSNTGIEQMFTPQVQVGDWPNLSWGLGWGIQQTEVGDLFWHWGAAAGFRNYIAGSREHRVGIIMFTNYEDGLPACSQILSVLDNPYIGVSHPAFDWLLPFEDWREDGQIV